MTSVTVMSTTNAGKVFHHSMNPSIVSPFGLSAPYPCGCGSYALPSDGMEACFNARCYRTDGGKCVHPFRVNISEPTVQVTRPIDATEVTDKAAATAALVTQIEKGMRASDNKPLTGRGPDFGTYLEELVEALQLDETRDHAYWRLWNLQLSDRLEKFGQQCRPRLQLGNQESLEDEYTHISHINPARCVVISNSDTRCSRIAEHSGYHEC